MSTEILTPEVEVLDLDNTINQSLVKANITDAVISKLKDQYGGMKLSSVDNKQEYLEIVQAKKEVRKIGILVEKITKSGREDAIAIQKKWLAKEKEILGKIAEVQDPLDAEIKKYEDEVARKEKEEQERKEREYMARQTTLLKMEAKYENDSFTLGGVSYEINNIKEADAEIWEETILPKYKREFEKIETLKAELEYAKQAAAAKLKSEQEELERKQKEFEEKQKQFELQQAELQRKQDEAQRKENERIAEEKRKQDEAENIKFSERMKLLAGWSFNGFTVSRHGDEIWGNKGDLIQMEDSSFAELVNANNQYVIQQDKLAKIKREQEIEEAKQLAIKQEQERKAEEEKQAKIKAQQEEERKQEELAKASDKEKWALYVQQIVAIAAPALKSNIYKGKLAQAKEKIEEIQAL